MIAALAAENRGFLKKRRSSIGLDDFSSHKKNADDEHDRRPRIR